MFAHFFRKKNTHGHLAKQLHLQNSNTHADYTSLQINMPLSTCADDAFQNTTFMRVL